MCEYFIDYDQIKEINQSLTIKISELPFTTRIKNALKYWDIFTISDLIQVDENLFNRFANIGKKSRKQIKEELNKKGLTLRKSAPLN